MPSCLGVGGRVEPWAGQSSLTWTLSVKCLCFVSVSSYRRVMIRSFKKEKKRRRSSICGKIVMYGLQAGGRKAWDMRNTIITERNINVHDQTKSFGSICFFSQRFHQKTDAHFTGGDWEGWADATVSRCTHTTKKKTSRALEAAHRGTSQPFTLSRAADCQKWGNPGCFVFLFFFKKTKQKTHTVHAEDSHSSEQQTFYILNIISQTRSVVFWPVSFSGLWLFGSLHRRPAAALTPPLLILLDSSFDSSSSQSCLSSGDNILSHLLQVFKK